MSFSQSQQTFTQQSQQQLQSSTPRTTDYQHLRTLPQNERVAFFQRALVQPTTIYILPNGSFSKLEAHVATSLHLTTPQSANATLAHEASFIFYTLNAFAISITLLPHLTTWTINNTFKPSLLITRLVVLYGPPTNPGGGNEELSCLLQLPNLRGLRLVFQDYEFKGLGPHYWLRPSLSVILPLASLPHLRLKLQRAVCSRGLDAQPEDIDTEDRNLVDVTDYLREPTKEEERVVKEMYRVVGEYKGPRASFEGILTEMGWSGEMAGLVVDQLSPRVAVKGWREEERRRGLGEVEMSGG
jgi:hypothetical protein